MVAGCAVSNSIAVFIDFWRGMNYFATAIPKDAMSVAIRLLVVVVLLTPVALTAQDREGRRERKSEEGRRGERGGPELSPERKRGSDSIKTPRSMPFRQGLAPDESVSGAQKSFPPQSDRSYIQVFDRVRDGLASGNFSLFAPHMASQVMMNLRGGESGTYSANQAYYVLENYFRARRILHLEFTTVGESDTNPYATGSAGLNIRGSRELVQVYVSLSRTGDRWVITQINIY